MARLPLYLAFLVPIGKQLQAVGGDGKKFWVVLGQQGNHLLKAIRQAHGHLGTFLVQQQVVKGGDGIKQD